MKKKKWTVYMVWVRQNKSQTVRNCNILILAALLVTKFLLLMHWRRLSYLLINVVSYILSARVLILFFSFLDTTAVVVAAAVATATNDASGVIWIVSWKYVLTYCWNWPIFFFFFNVLLYNSADDTINEMLNTKVKCAPAVDVFISVKKSRSKQFCQKTKQKISLVYFSFLRFFLCFLNYFNISRCVIVFEFAKQNKSL